MKRKLLIVFVLIFILVWGGKRIYWYVNSDYHNLSIIIFNNKSWYEEKDTLPPLSIKIHIDDSLIYKNDFIVMPYNFVKERINVGYHKLTVEIDSRVTGSIQFCVLPMKWIVVEYPLSEENGDSMLITTYLSPPGIE